MTEAEVGRRYALKQGIPAHNILFENTSRNTTYENLRNIVPIMHANGVGSIIVVSDPYHLSARRRNGRRFGLVRRVSATPTRALTSAAKKVPDAGELFFCFSYRIGKWSDAVWDWIGG